MKTLTQKQTINRDALKKASRWMQELAAKKQASKQSATNTRPAKVVGFIQL